MPIYIPRDIALEIQSYLYSNDQVKTFSVATSFHNQDPTQIYIWYQGKLPEWVTKVIVGKKVTDLQVQKANHLIYLDASCNFYVRTETINKMPNLKILYSTHNPNQVYCGKLEHLSFFPAITDGRSDYPNCDGLSTDEISKTLTNLEHDNVRLFWLLAFSKEPLVKLICKKIVEDRKKNKKYPVEWLKFWEI